MKSKPNKPTIYPSQLIEEFIKFNDWAETNNVSLDPIRFQKLTKEIEETFEVDFDYFDLQHYVGRFNHPFVIIEEEEIHLHSSCKERLLRHLEWYNRMYLSNDEIVTGNIYKIWKELK